MAQPLVSHANDLPTGMPVDLTNCDREPIHIPGSIQPYGFLLCLDEHTRRVVLASANTQELLGIAAEDLHGAGLERLLGPTHLAEVEGIFTTLTEACRLLGVRLDHVAGQPYYKLILHRYDQLLWVEGEAVADGGVGMLDLPSLNLTLSRLLTANSVLECCQVAAEQIRSIAGFDRVAIYRFAEDESGAVVAEALREDMAPWLGIHYPATDIPKQARAMYLKNWLRFIADAAYQAVPLVPDLNPRTGLPPDMTYAVLRSVSPIHLQSLHNMGTGATMTISLIQDGRLWGMVACHHESPRLVSYEVRDLCMFLGKTLSALLKTKEQQDESAYRQNIQKSQVQLLAQVSARGNFSQEVHRFGPTLLEVFDCGGAAVCAGGQTTILGQTPTQLQITELVDWLSTHSNQKVFHTNSYAKLNPAGQTIRATASGVLALALNEDAGEYILWFRPEQIREVKWGGRYEKEQVTEDGQVFLSPRHSFKVWAETVKEVAAPWRALEIEAAKEIRQHISDVRLKIFSELQAKTISLAHLNAELQRSNDELDSFAYVASHDLKEPLRGIHNYAIFLLEDYAQQLDAEGVDKLQTLVRLSKRMEALIESLLQIARVGRLDLTLETADLNEDFNEVLDLLHPRLNQTQTTVTVVAPLPTVRCDRTRIREVFNNLLTNAMRYNDLPDKQVVVGVAPADLRGPRGTGNPTNFDVLFVRDNGIGIAPRHHENIFKVFKRLHAPDKYGGGTGAGLAIAKVMVEKHGGELWVESAPGFGATFYFSISKHL